jgi:beta-propeller repeat-containing protein
VQFFGSRSAFAAELNSNGSALIFSTFFGGSQFTNANAIAVDDSGNIYVGGQTQSADFPIVNAVQAAFGGVIDGFILKLNPKDESTGNVLSLSTTTGNYQFATCGGITIEGIGVISKRGCLLTVQDNVPDRRLLARVDTCLSNGSASIQPFSPGKTFTILDRNTANNTCAYSH